MDTLNQNLSKPLFVLISDVHYSLNTLTLADAAFNAAIDKAHELQIPLIDAGDITNDKAILRAEVMNAMIKTMKRAKRLGVQVTLIVGNHSLINEKGKEHALTFLYPYVQVMDSLSILPIQDTEVYMLPYQSNINEFKAHLNDIPEDALMIMHQGVNGAFMGDYIQDKSAVTQDLFGNRTVFSGHYHRHQKVGKVTYIGNPYTLGYVEAHDGSKGFLIVYSDGSFTREILDFPKYISLKATITERGAHLDNPEDLPESIGITDRLKMTLTGPQSILNTVDKNDLICLLTGRVISDYRLDLKSIDIVSKEVIQYTSQDPNDILDQVIMISEETAEQKEKLKKLWRSL
jgi:DNA repair exonuclease SbcCD nuclease subunit